jgi:ABC-2 type transport system permease protein
MADDAQILHRGYRTYDGPRTGVIGALRTVAFQGVRHVLGLGRPAKAKILPIATAAIAFVPAVVYVGLAVLLGDAVQLLEEGEVVPTYSDYYGVILLALVMFAAFVAPEALTGDRRNGLLALYLSTPLTRMTYLGAKYLGILAVMSIVTVGPPMVFLIGYTFEGAGPDGFVAWIGVFWRIIAVGLIISAVFTGVAFAVSSVTDRRAWASVGTVLVLLLSATVTAVLNEGAGVGDNILLLNLLVTPFELAVRMYGDPIQNPGLGTTALAVATAAWTFGGLGVAVVRYRTMEVSR